MAARRRKNPVTSKTDDSATGEETVESAEERVARAREDLKRAQQFYRETLERAEQRLDHVRSMTVGQVIDQTMELVRTHPAIGVAVAAGAGYFAGRLFHRR